MSTTTVLLPSHYLPCIDYLKACASATTILIEQHESYVKGSYRNRAHIASAAGVQRLSIPLEKGKHQRQPMKDVRISYAQHWQRLHRQSLCSSYNHSPYFEFYKDGLEEFYQKKINFLLDWNTELLHWLLKVFKLKTGIQVASEYQKNYPGNVADKRNNFDPKSVTGSPIIYKQLFESRHGFLPNLSSVDLLFNDGTDKLL